jgi:tetratricopeptide repeat protein 8
LFDVRPGTSLSTPQTASKSGYDQGLRPVTQSGRPVTGFSRPMSSRPMSGATSVRDALQSSRGTTARPMTTLGREVRLGTASLAAGNGKLVDVERINIKKYASKIGLGMILAEYLLYVEHNNRKALELCAEATKAHNYKNWWWKARLGKCYYKLGKKYSALRTNSTNHKLYRILGLLRDAEKQYLSSIKEQPIINTYLELCNVYLRLDLPNTALDILQEAR